MFKTLKKKNKSIESKVQIDLKKNQLEILELQNTTREVKAN